MSVSVKADMMKTANDLVTEHKHKMSVLEFGRVPFG